MQKVHVLFWVPLYQFCVLLIFSPKHPHEVDIITLILEIMNQLQEG